MQMRFGQVCRAARDIVVGSSRHEAYVEVNKHCGPLKVGRDRLVWTLAETMFAPRSHPAHRCHAELLLGPQAAFDPHFQTSKLIWPQHLKIVYPFTAVW